MLNRHLSTMPGIPNNRSEWDLSIIGTALVAFGLPLTLLVPGFSIWNLIPKIQVRRLHIFSYPFTWEQNNGLLFGALVLFFCFFLELRKRKLNDMVERVLSLRDATDAALAAESERQADAREVCGQALAASGEHYEHVALLQDELRRRRPVRHAPPSIDSTNFEN